MLHVLCVGCDVVFIEQNSDVTVTPRTLRHAIFDTCLEEKVQPRQHAVFVCAVHILKHFCIFSTYGATTFLNERIENVVAPA